MLRSYIFGKPEIFDLLSSKLLNTGILFHIDGRFSSLQQLVVSIINLARSLHCQFSVHFQILSVSSPARAQQLC